jgi:ribonucleoside-diphosphate reductase subunit M1
VDQATLNQTVDRLSLKEYNQKTQEENEAAMVCSIDNKDACVSCSG